MKKDDWVLKKAQLTWHRVSWNITNKEAFVCAIPTSVVYPSLLTYTLLSIARNSASVAFIVFAHLSPPCFYLRSRSLC